MNILNQSFLTIEEVFSFGIWIAENYYHVNTDESYISLPRWHTSQSGWVANSDLELLETFIKHHYTQVGLMGDFFANITDRGYEVLHHIEELKNNKKLN